MYSYRIVTTKKGIDKHYLSHFSNSVFYELIFSCGKIKSRAKEMRYSPIVEEQRIEKETYENRIDELLTNYKFL